MLASDLRLAKDQPIATYCDQRALPRVKDHVWDEWVRRDPVAYRAPTTNHQHPSPVCGAYRCNTRCVHSIACQFCYSVPQAIGLALSLSQEETCMIAFNVTPEAPNRRCKRGKEFARHPQPRLR
eukprot:3641756-Pleurochrysis_carterae.AAC.1